MSRTLVTGGTGYVGVKVVEEMQAAGREVRVIEATGEHDRAPTHQRARESGLSSSSRMRARNSAPSAP